MTCKALRRTPLLYRGHTDRGTRVGPFQHLRIAPEVAITNDRGKAVDMDKVVYLWLNRRRTYWSPLSPGRVAPDVNRPDHTHPRNARCRIS